MAFNPATFRANGGFVNPTLYGFSDRIHDLEMRMFPFQEHFEEDQGNQETIQFLRFCGIPNAEALLGANGSCREMAGIIWSTCLFSPRLTRESQRDAERFVPNRLLPPPHGDDIYDQYFNGVDGATPSSWLGYYFTNQIHTLITHLNLNNEENVPSGFNTFLDVTPGSFFVKPVHIRTVLTKVRDYTVAHSLGDLTLSDRVRHIKVDICTRLSAAVTDESYLPLWKIYVAMMYTIFRTVKGDSATGYPCRIYLYRRLGRFQAAPVGIGQYIRYFTWFQRPFNYFANSYLPVQKCIFRDAHATGIHRISNQVDRAYFESCEGTGTRQVMLGLSPLYKCNRHAKLSDGVRTMFNNQEEPAANPIDTVNPERMGVLAGIVWSYNPSRDQSLFGYDIFFLPFEGLTEPIAGIRYPVNMSAEDQTWNFWGYGQDEYILSRLLHLRATNPEVWDDANVLYYQMNWLGRVIGTDVRRSEFYPQTINAFRGIVGPREAALRTQHGVNLGNYFNALIDTFQLGVFPISSKQSILEFMFGSINVQARIDEGYVNIPADDGVNIAYRTDPANFVCNVHTAFRIDRFDYWNNPGNRVAGQIHSNLQNVLANLNFCVRNKISRECGIGVRRCDDNAPPACAAVILPGNAAAAPAVVVPPPQPPAPPAPAPAPPGIDPAMLARAQQRARAFFGIPGAAQPAPRNQRGRFGGLLNDEDDRVANLLGQQPAWIRLAGQLQQPFGQAQGQGLAGLGQPAFMRMRGQLRDPHIAQAIQLGFPNAVAAAGFLRARNQRRARWGLK